MVYYIGLNELFVFLCAFLFPVLSGLAYGILFIIKVLRWLICFVLKQNSNAILSKPHDPNFSKR
ncbi:hypothetical protein A9G24_02930 [Gilliamella sp. App6-5]|nr:hypothetical protein A9G24_02930 [Gilliamella apicola]